MKKCISIKVSGLVQGVWFRKSTQSKALELGLHGFVRNEKDGSVYIEAEGDELILSAFTSWCRSGPPAAKVSDVKVEEIPMNNFTSFRIA